MFQKIFQKLLQEFFVTMGRAPSTPMEWSKLRIKAKELAEKSGGITDITKKTTIPEVSSKQLEFDLSTKIPGPVEANIIPFPLRKDRKFQKLSGGVENLLRTGQARFGKALKTTPEHLKAKKDRHILFRDAEEDILRKKRENKQAIEEFKRKFGKDTVEDLRDKGDWDPYGMAQGGIAPLVGEPSYAADFYDDRTPMKRGKKATKKKTVTQTIMDAMPK